MLLNITPTKMEKRNSQLGHGQPMEQTNWLSLVVSNCEFVTFPLVSWVGCGS